MATRQCSKCGVSKPLSEFTPRVNGKHGKDSRCRECRNAIQRERRKRNGNAPTRKYEKTKRGFLMRLYRNMQSRVTGIQAQKYHLYEGKALGITRDEFYEWALGSPDFHRLFREWEMSGHDRRLTPSVDRVDSSRGYWLWNMEWVTHSENSRRGAVSERRQKSTMRGQMSLDFLLRRYL